MLQARRGWLVWLGNRDPLGDLGGARPWGGIQYCFFPPFLLCLDAQGPRSLDPGNTENQGQRPRQPVRGREEGQDLISHSMQVPPALSHHPQKVYLVPSRLRAQCRKRVPGQRVEPFQWSPNIHPFHEFPVGSLLTRLWLGMALVIGGAQVIEQWCGFPLRGVLTICSVSLWNLWQ